MMMETPSRFAGFSNMGCHLMVDMEEKPEMGVVREKRDDTQNICNMYIYIYTYIIILHT